MIVLAVTEIRNLHMLIDNLSESKRGRDLNLVAKTGIETVSVALN